MLRYRHDVKSNPPNPADGISRLSLLVGLVAGEICSAYLTFVAHTMNPVSYRLVENIPTLRAIYGRYQEVQNWDGLLFTLVASFAVFALSWTLVQEFTRTPLVSWGWYSTKQNLHTRVGQKALT
jgi:hypothetical protein